MAKWGDIPPVPPVEPWINHLTMKTPDKPDPVNSPPHYNSSYIECIDAMTAMAEGTVLPSHASYCWQNAFKYLWRFPYKHKTTEGSLTDLKKCQFYLARLITQIEINK